MNWGSSLEVDALPDTADRSVPALLAMGNFGEAEIGEIRVVAGIEHPDHQLVAVAGAEGLGDVELKGEVAPLVLAHLLPIEPDGGVVVDRAEVDVEGGRSGSSGRSGRIIGRWVRSFRFFRLFHLLKPQTIPRHPTV